MKRTGALTHAEIAERLGMSRTMVQHIEKRAIAKLMKGLRAAGMDAADLEKRESREIGSAFGN